MIESVRTKTVVDLVKGKLGAVKSIDMNASYLWNALDITKEDLGVEDDNLVLEVAVLPSTGEPGQIVRSGGKLFRWDA